MSDTSLPQPVTQAYIVGRDLSRKSLSELSERTSVRSSKRTSLAATKDNDNTEVYNREIEYDENAAMKAFHRLVRNTPIVFGWNPTDRDHESIDQEIDHQAEFLEFENTFVAASLKHRPSILLDYEHPEDESSVASRECHMNSGEHVQDGIHPL